MDHVRHPEAGQNLRATVTRGLMQGRARVLVLPNISETSLKI